MRAETAGNRFRDPAVWAPAAAFAAVCLALALVAGFHQAHNDYWDTHFIASHLAWGDRRTWFNPQYPAGYVLLLRGLLALGDPVAPAAVVNILFAAGTVAIAARLYRAAMPPVFAALAAAALCVFPEFLHYAGTGGGDPGSVLLFTAGAALALGALLRSPDRDAPGRFFAAGLLLGGSGLFRYHALVAAALLGLALLAAFPRRWRSGACAAAGAALAYSPQWAVNLLSGHGLMETQFGPMNVYDLMHGLNWHRITGLSLPASVGDIIAQDPGLFFRKYAAAVWSFKHAWLPAVAAAVFEREPRLRRVALALALWAAAYFLLFSATTSGRQALLAVPLTFLSLGLCARLLWNFFGGLPRSTRPFLRPTLAALLAAGLFGLHVSRDVQDFRKRVRSRDETAAVESYLKGAGVARANQVFTSDFNLYFRSLPPYVPYFNGGAPRLGTYLYNEVFPEFPADSPGEFLDACRRRGVRFVVLHAGAPKVSETLGSLYAGAEFAGLEPAYRADRYRVYRVR